MSLLQVTLSSTNPLCSNLCTGTIATSVMGGTPPYSFAWTKNNVPFSNSQNLANLCDGTYSLTVTDSGTDFNSYSQLLDFSTTTSVAPTDLILINGIFYGTTYLGGTHNKGTLFSFNPTTNTYTKLYDFNTTNGENPSSTLLLASNGLVYGTTVNGGNNNIGTLFSYDLFANVLTKLYDFTILDGNLPYGDLVELGGFLWGTAEQGGANGDGVLYKFNPLTNAYTNVYDLNDGALDGKNPLSGMTVVGGKLYGVTRSGGANGNGSIFSLTTGGAFNNIHDFTGTDGDASSTTMFLASDGLLYGMTEAGGANNKGVIFKFKIAGSVYTKLRDFSGWDGQKPLRNKFMEISGTLWGNTSLGGANSSGVIFNYSLALGFDRFYDFLGTPSGANPQCGFVFYNDALYGTTYNGGVPGDIGTLFKIFHSGSVSASATITSPSPIVANETITPPTCAGDDGLIFVNPTGGTPTYTYLWSNGNTTNSIIALAGTYSLTITDSNGCTATFSFTIPPTQPITVLIDVKLQKCYEGEIELKALPDGGLAPYSFLWSTGETTQTIQADAGKEYTVSVTDSNGCSGSGLVDIPTQLDSYECCLADKLGKIDERQISGLKVSNRCEIDAFLLEILIDAYEGTLTDFSGGVDQEYINVTTHTPQIFGTVTGAKLVTQSFVPTIENISGVSVKTDVSVGTFTSDVIISIYTQSGGNPNTLVASATIPNATWVANSGKLITVDFSSAARLIPNQTYLIQYSTSAQSDTNYPQLYSDSSGTYGTVRQQVGGIWSTIAGETIVFETFGEAYSRCLTDDEKLILRSKLVEECGCCGACGGSSTIQLTPSTPSPVPPSAPCRNNFTATTNPTVNDDKAAGYCKGNMWLNNNTMTMWMSYDDTNGAADWRIISNP